VAHSRFDSSFDPLASIDDGFTAGANTRSLQLVSLISACVEANAMVQRFEVLAGRCAMVGLVAALGTELVFPEEGLFTSWDQQCFTGFSILTLLLLSSSVSLALQSKKKLGRTFTEAVNTSLTALSGSLVSLTNRSVDDAVDYVFESVFSTEMVQKNFLVDE
jgi:hypothetical protein